MPKMLEAMYPENVSLYQSGGCEILACIDRDSDLAETIESQQLGVVIDRPTGRAIANAVTDRADTWKSKGNAGAARRQFPHQQQEREAESWCEVLEQLGGFVTSNDVDQETPVENLL